MVKCMLKRELYLSKIRSFYQSDLIKILVGIRRCGKSVILHQIMEELLENGVQSDHILYLNFEYIEYEELQDYKKLNAYIKEKVLDHKLYYLFFDEIQNVDSFEKVINSIRASLTNVSIFMTGSNSRLLSDEISSVLSGRYVSFSVYPLNYREFILLTGKDGQDENSLKDFMYWGGLPNRVQFTDETNIKDYLHAVFDSIIVRDVIERTGIRDITLFNTILQYLIDTTGREFSAQHVLNALAKEGRDISSSVLYKYIDALCKALIIQKVYRYDVHGKAILQTRSKYYMTDLGIAHIKNHDFFINNAFSLENVVYNELKSRGYQVYTGKTKKGEVDFVCEKDRQICYIQVAYLLSNEKVVEREFGAFDAIEDNYPKYVISMDTMDFSRNGIHHINLLDFLQGKPV